MTRADPKAPVQTAENSPTNPTVYPPKPIPYPAVYYATSVCKNVEFVFYGPSKPVLEYLIWYGLVGIRVNEIIDIIIPYRAIASQNKIDIKFLDLTSGWCTVAYVRDVPTM